MTLKAFSKVVSENIDAIYGHKLLFGQLWNSGSGLDFNVNISAAFLKSKPRFYIRDA
jgi:hypothetical protein